MIPSIIVSKIAYLYAASHIVLVRVFSWLYFMEIASTNGSCWVVELLICGQYATVDVLIDKVVWNHHYANDALICQTKYLLTVAYISCDNIKHIPVVFTGRCYASTVLAIGLCLCLCLSVTSRSSTKTAKQRSHKQHHTIAQGL